MSLEILAGLVLALAVYVEIRARLSHQSFVNEARQIAQESETRIVDLLHIHHASVTTKIAAIPPSVSVPVIAPSAAPPASGVKNDNIWNATGTAIVGTDFAPNGYLWNPGYRPATRTWDPTAQEQGVPPDDPKYVRPRQFKPGEVDGTFGNTVTVDKPTSPTP